MVLELKSRPNLRAPGAAEALRRFSSGFEGGVSILRRHRDGRLDFRQTASRGSGQYRRGGGPFIRELSNDQPIVVAEGQVPGDEPASYALEELGNGFLTIKPCVSRRSPVEIFPATEIVARRDVQASGKPE